MRLQVVIFYVTAVVQVPSVGTPTRVQSVGTRTGVPTFGTRIGVRYRYDHRHRRPPQRRGWSGQPSQTTTHAAYSRGGRRHR